MHLSLSQMKLIIRIAYYLFFMVCLQAQAQMPATNLVMEGGGVRAFAYVGALSVLDSAGVLSNIHRVGGTSGGAIIAALYAVGYSTAELDSIARNIPVQNFADDGGFLSRRILRVRKKFGWYKGDALTTWLQSLIAQKIGNGNITLLQLHQMAINSPVKDVYTTTVDLSTQQALVLSHRTRPQMRLVDAVRCSMSIPLAYTAVFVDKQGRTYANSSDAPNLHILVDGGLLNNYPIAMFDSIPLYHVKTNVEIDSVATLGIMLQDQDFTPKENTMVPITNLKGYVNAVYHTVIDKSLLTDRDRQRSIIVSLDGIGPMVKKMPKATIEYMLLQGRAGAYEYLSRN
jgi:NTE family protein